MILNDFVDKFRRREITREYFIISEKSCGLLLVAQPFEHREFMNQTKTVLNDSAYAAFRL